MTELKVKGEGQATTTKSQQVGCYFILYVNGVVVICNCRMRKCMHCSLNWLSQLTSTGLILSRHVHVLGYLIINNLAMVAIPLLQRESAWFGCCLSSLPPCSPCHKLTVRPLPCLLELHLSLPPLTLYQLQLIKQLKKMTFLLLPSLGSDCTRS